MIDNALLVLAFGGLLLGGLRAPWAWTIAAAAIWTLGLRGRPGAGLGRAARWAPWLLWAALSLLLSAQPWTGLYAFSRWAAQLFFFGLCSAAAANPEWRRRWFWSLAAAAPVLALAAYFVRSPDGTLTGLIPPYYNYTMFVEAAFVAAAAAALGHPRGPRGRARAALWAGLVLALAVIAAARSRGALAAAGASVLVWAAVKARRPRRVALAGVLAAGAAALALALVPREAWRHFLKLDMGQWFTRPQIWRAALQASADHPWLGEGPGQFGLGFRRHNFAKHWASNYGFFADHAHSEPLEILAETGWPGLLLFSGALAACVRALGEDYASEAAAFAGLSMALQGLVDNMLQLPALGLLFFSALACAAGPTAQPRRVPSRRAWLWGCGLGLLLAVTALAPRVLLDAFWRREAAADSGEERLRWLSEIEDLSPADEALYEARARAWLSVTPPQPEKALAQLRRARALNPTNAYYPELAAEIAEVAGRPAEALARADEALALEPNFLAARLLRARALGALGRRPEAREELAELARRRAALSSMTLYTGYDRGLTFVDEARLSQTARDLR